MAHHGRHEPRVEVVIADLARLVLRFGSVNALAEILSSAFGDDSIRIYPSRIHALLTVDESRGVNTGTLRSLEDSIAVTEEPNTWEINPDEVRTALSDHTGDPRQVDRVADRFGVPTGVVLSVATEGQVQSTSEGNPPPRDRVVPDWSWQDMAVKQSLDALRKDTGPKIGLILPTGAGKTRVALRVALDWLKNKESIVLWVTHRVQLRRQARRTLQTLMKDSDLGAEESAALFERVQFVMTHGLGERIDELSANALIIVDEAHHMAAASYKPIYDQTEIATLLLTATPNRTDALPIGIDEIAYTTSYRHLFELGCVIEPTFEAPEEMPTLDWTTRTGLHELADYLLDRTEDDFSKPLVAVSRKIHAEKLYEALQDRLDARKSHPLSFEDIGFVHGGSNSRHTAESGDFLDEFSAKPAGILVATSQLVGEGFDDPYIDAAVVTYASTSISHLMQVAGRALRSAPGKTTAHVVQVRQSPLEYYFEQRWLYQDISDTLRPDLMDLSYTTTDDLKQQIEKIFDDHNVADPIRRRIRVESSAIQPGERINILLSGLPYSGSVESFDTSAEWNALLPTTAERDRFLRIFNEVSIQTDDMKDINVYLDGQIRQDFSAGSLWRSYAVLILGMEYARRETTKTPYHGQENRNYRPGKATTWLRYVTFEFRPRVPSDLQEFLADAYNREDLLVEYTNAPSHWNLALRLDLPGSGSQGFLLDRVQGEWFSKQHRQLMVRLGEVERSHSVDTLAEWRSALVSTPIPVRIIEHFGQFLRLECEDQHVLRLSV